MLLAVGQEHVLGDGNGRLADLLVAFQLLEAVAVSLQPLGAPEPLEAARGDRLVEQAIVILLVIELPQGTPSAETARANLSRDRPLNCAAS